MLKLIQLNIFIACLSISTTISGQTVLMQEKTNAYDFKMPKAGPNFRHFAHLYIGFGSFIPDNKEYEVKTGLGATTSLEFGWRYKLKLTNWLAAGTGINYINDIFDIKQVEKKFIPDTLMHSKEKLRFNNLGSEFYIRFNFGKRGNIVGRFVDLGAYANWAFKVKQMYVDKVDQNLPQRATSQRVILYHLDYIERFNYGLKARIGLNRIVFTGFYRMSDLFSADFKAEVGEYYLPRLSVGIELGLFK